MTDNAGMQTTRTTRIPLAEPNLDEADAQAVYACIQSGWVSTYSPLVPQFEKAMAHFLGIESSLAVNCGTAAIHLALLVLGIQPGDKVAVPALTFVASVNPVRYLGAIPVFVDADPATFGMCPTALAQTLSDFPDIKAVVVTHLYGHLADIAAIKAVAGHRPVIEDAAEALGSRTLDGQYAGTLADLGCYSFNGNKTITTGSGGLLVAKQAAMLAHARHLATQAKSMDTIEFDHTTVGYNYRMNGIQAALGLSQLQKLPHFLRRKRFIADYYAKMLPHITPHLQCLGLQIPWLVTVLFDQEDDRFNCQKILTMGCITFRPFFKPLPALQPFMPFAHTTCTTAMNLWQRGLCLPSDVNLDMDLLNQVFSKINNIKKY